MENQPKLNSSKEVIAYLAKQFPLCFIAEGEAKPLKIGIFQDLVTRLTAENAVSKTQLRTALRLYTTSWRYLYGIKVGAERIDLDGNACGILEEQHVEHAKKQLEEAKARVQAQRAEQRAKAAAESGEKNTKRPPRPVNKKIVTPRPTVPESGATKPEVAKKPAVKQTIVKTVDSQATKLLSAAEIAKIKIGQNIKVKAGQSAMDATVLEIVKDGARVQLASGLAMIVRAEHLQL